jgi:formiminoglutamase
MTSTIDMSVWQGRVDAAEGALGRRWHQVMQPLDAATPAGTVVLNGFACDAGVARNQGRPGAADGPAAIRQALGNMPVHECERLADAGGVACIGDALEDAQSMLAERIAEQLQRGLFPIALGGGHEVGFASFTGLATQLAQASDGQHSAARIGIVNFDAHFDLRRADRPNSGTPFLQMADDCERRGWPFSYCCVGVSRYANTEALFERARQLDVVWMLDENMEAMEPAAGMLTAFLSEVDHVYLTVCLDALPASVAPGVSSPAARGVALAVIEPLIDAVIVSGKVRLADIAEMNPRFDLDRRTAAVAARLVARIANGIARAAIR